MAQQLRTVLKHTILPIQSILFPALQLLQRPDCNTLDQKVNVQTLLLSPPLHKTMHGTLFSQD
jgi:hypothetical protein